MQNIKILVIESQFTSHNIFNTGLISALNEIAEVTFIDLERQYSKIPCQKYIPISAFGQKNKIIRLISYLYFILKLNNHLKNNKYDLLLFTSYHNKIFSFFFQKKNRLIYLIEHNNIDSMHIRLLDKFILKYLVRNCISLCLEEYIASYMRSIGREAYYIPHPLNYDLINTAESTSKFNNYIFSPSNGLDIAAINRLAIFANESKLNVLAKYKKEIKIGNYFTTKLHFKDYCNLLKNANKILFFGDFKYRISNVVFEAISSGIPVFVVDSIFSRKIVEKYPSCVKIISKLEDINQIQIDFNLLEQQKKLFLQEHSPDSIKSKLKSIFGTRFKSDFYKSNISRTHNF
jgi:hypothetical protein